MSGFVFPHILSSLHFSLKEEKKLSVRCFLKISRSHLLLFPQVTDRNGEKPETWHTPRLLIADAVE